MKVGDTASVSLYRKYRGLSFDDIVGQQHITDVLQRSIKNDRISHAYLFTGPHGVGKTSVARVMAHAINGLEYKHEDNHIDIIEIDAASNRRIDEIRDLREKSHIAPVSARYKVYIIDEVHMLTKEAFNALLKTLEEPPAHVVFILATTEAYKLPQTIISRTQRHTFKPIDDDAAFKHLNYIAKQEKITVEPEAIKLLVKHGNGSFRDAISLLDQVSGHDSKSISVTDVESMLGLASNDETAALLTATLAGNAALILSTLRELTINGLQPEVLSNQLLDELRRSDSYTSHLQLAEALLSVPAHTQPELKLEVVLLQYRGSQPAQAPSATPAAPTKPASEPKQPTIQKPIEPPKEAIPQSPPAEEVATETEQATAEEPETAEAEAAPASENAASVDNEAWQKVLAAVKSKNNAIASILRSQPPEISDNTVTVFVKFGFHKKKLDDKPTLAMIQEAASEALGGPVDLNVKVRADAQQAEAGTPSAVDNTSEADQLADSIISTFGGGEKVNI